MNSRLAFGLAVGAGYVLGRTKKAKLAFAVGTMVAGKRLNLNPGALGEFITHQLRDNPQFKAVGEQLRTDLGGVGKAATGAFVSRHLDGLADRLHDRTADVQDRVKDALSGSNGEKHDSPSSADDEEREDLEDHADDESEDAPAEREKAARPARRPEKPAAKRAPAKKTARAPEKRAPRKAAPKGDRTRG
ncbi:DNA primase [Streptomyces albipurpureus]|uniref:DNA primase n=1 Tax=Streptomyces albipurpureus TaxID=2897419 RepID=A0ABT0USQ7_9ACTN|nr:DNA primase [Streptomyces sp. CWNU-1]MCM2390655.1 DNA primase [Streptomyces sp. CWNU-1]